MSSNKLHHKIIISHFGAMIKSKMVYEVLGSYYDLGFNVTTECDILHQFMSKLHQP